MELSLDLTPDLIVAFLTLFILEIVLGVDNVIFISILASKLPVEQQAKARNLGLTLAMVMRIGLLFAASWIISLTADLFQLFGLGFSGRDLILILGGLFLVYKAVKEIHEKLEGEESHGTGRVATATFGAVLVQILLLDIIFSFDSVITAVGMVDNLLVIIVAVVLSFGIMLFSSKYIFAVVVEALNILQRRRQAKRVGKDVEPVHLRHAYSKADDRDAVAAATSNAPDAGAVNLSRKPVSGAVRPGDGHQEPAGLG